MAYSFGDGFDCYAAVADAINGYWDSGVSNNFLLVNGRFSGSRAIQNNANSTNTAMLVKSSGANDAVHHIAVAYQTNVALTGTNLIYGFSLLDATTAQCSVIFRSDGAILLISGLPNSGTTLATYTGAVTVINTWYQFEFEIVVNNTTGSFKVRKNGNTSDDHSTTGINTRPTSANNYANKLQIMTGPNGVSGNPSFDDFFWRSDASSVAWMGDIKCVTRMPVSDASVQFSRTPTTALAQYSSGATTGALSAGIIRAVRVVASVGGTVPSLVFNFNAGITGHAKMALYDSTFALVASSAELTNPGAGLNTFAVASNPVVTRGATYWVALWSDVSITGLSGSTPTSGDTSQTTLTYTTSFPSTMPAAGGASWTGLGSNGMNITSFNAGCVGDPQQDATTTYVYDSTAGHADFYGIAPITGTPSATIAVTSRAYMQKSDAGSRTAAVQLKSGGTTVASPTLTLTTSGWLWTYRTDVVDPNTSTAWTAAAVNAATIGPSVVS